MIRALDISGSALQAQRVRMDVIAGNIANAFVTQQEDGTVEPYRRRVTLFSPQAGDGGPGVRVRDVIEDESPFRMRFDPGHPHAIPDGPEAGYVRYPNVNITMEYVDAMEAGRAYEANIAMMNLSRAMAQRGIELMA
ncbi:MAG: flagellar basal body rod protein FlgC [Phycisphaerales bacterium]|nr:flagellar basal body rod protein FlgC [Phycisphaerales bacterium]